MKVSYLQIYILVFLISLIPKTILIIFFPGTIDQSDPQGHIFVAKNILSGCGISNSIPGSGECILSHGSEKGPGYPIILAFLMKISNESFFLLRFFNALLLSISILYLISTLKPILKSKVSILFIGCVLSISPVTLAWSRFLLTESLSISLTLLIFSEIIKLLFLKEFNFLRISFFITLATFIRIDLVFLFLPLIIALFLKYNLNFFSKKLISIFLIFSITWSLWFIRNYYYGLNILPQHGGIEIFRQEVDSTKNYSGDGYIKWTNTWVHNEYQRSAALHPKTNFKEIYIDFKKINLDEELKNRSIELIIKLKTMNQKYFPKKIDDEFETIANKVIERDRINYYFTLPLKRIFFQWSNMSNSNGWPLEFRKLTYEDRINIINSRIGEKIQFVKNNLFFSLSKILPNIWRVFILIIFFISFFYFWKNEFRNFILVTLSYFIIKNVFSMYFVFIEVRYLVNILPIFEVIACLCLLDLFNKKNQKFTKLINRYTKK